MNSRFDKKKFSQYHRTKPTFLKETFTTPELFIGGLPSSASEQDLIELFSQFGDLKSLRLMFYRDGNPRGFAFLRLANLEQTYQVLSTPGLAIAGKPIECKIALNKEESKTHIEQEVLRRVYVKNLVPQISESDLGYYFGMFGEVVNIRIATEMYSNEPKGFAFITFDSIHSASRVLSYPAKHRLKGAVLSCNYAYVKSHIESSRTFHPTHSSSKTLVSSPTTQIAEDYDNLVFRRRKNSGHPQSASHLSKLISKINMPTWPSTPYFKASFSAMGSTLMENL